MIHSCPICGATNRLPAERVHQHGRCGQCKRTLSPLVSPVEIHSATDFSEIVEKSSLPVLIDFWAPWCAPCRLVAPELRKVADQRRGRLLVAKVNTEEVPDVANRYGVDGFPTMIVFRGGKETNRTSGAQPASGIMRELDL